MTLTTINLAALGDTINLGTEVTGTLPTGNGGTGSTATTFVNAASNVTGTLATTNGGTGATSFAPGKVLQVVQNSLTSEISTSSASFVTSGLTTTLTPSSTSHKIMIFLNGGRNSYGDGSQDPNKLCTTFYSSIGGATASDILGSHPLTNQDLFAGTGGYSFQHSGSFLYSPNTTSSVAISAFFKATGDLGTPFFNHTSQSITPRVTLTLMEISA
jgi:hypothetical protein